MLDIPATVAAQPHPQNVRLQAIHYPATPETSDWWMVTAQSAVIDRLYGETYPLDPVSLETAEADIYVAAACQQVTEHLIQRMQGSVI